MEKTLTRNELLSYLLDKAQNPFTTMEQKNDVKRVLMESNTMRGMNHLFLAKCYFDENPLFSISRKEAIRQATLAFQENNTGAYYYLFLLLKDSNPSKARNFLRLSASSGNPKAFLAMAKYQHDGILFEKNIDEAFKNYKIAASCSLYDGYFGMLLIASEKHDVELEKQIYKEALLKGFKLPGIIE